MKLNLLDGPRGKRDVRQWLDTLVRAGLVVLVVVATAILPLAVMFLVTFWGWMEQVLLTLSTLGTTVPSYSTIAKDLADILVRAITGAVQLAGILVLGLGLYFTLRQVRASEGNLENARHTLETTRQGQVNDRFIKAIEQLGDKDSITMRLGGIYALEGIARQSDDLYWPVMEVLTGFLREYARPPAEVFEPEIEIESDSAVTLQKLRPTDIQAIFTVLARRRKSYTNGEMERLDLRGTHWRSTDLRGTDLSGADFAGADFGRADLFGTDLRGAVLAEAFLARAFLAESFLVGAFLVRADLREADLQMAKLGMAKLFGADLRGANLFGANLSGADVRGANLSGADLTEANLSEVIGLTVAQLCSAATYEGAELPPELLAELEREGMPPP